MFGCSFAESLSDSEKSRHVACEGRRVSRWKLHFPSIHLDHILKSLALTFRNGTEPFELRESRIPRNALIDTSKSAALAIHPQCQSAGRRAIRASVPDRKMTERDE